MAKVAQKSPIKTKPLTKKADTSSSSSSSSDSDDEPQIPTKASATKPSKLPVAALTKSTPVSTPNNNDKKRPKESSSSSSEEDEAPASKKIAVSRPPTIAPVPKQAYPSKIQPQKEQPPKEQPKQNDVMVKTKVSVKVNTNFETPCPHCGHKLEINMNIA